MKKLGTLHSFLIFAAAGVALFLVTHILIPFLSVYTGIEPVIFWFICAGLGVFFPLLITAFLLLKREGLSLDKNCWVNRLRFKPLNKLDILWSIGAIIIIGIFSFFIMQLQESFFGMIDNQPVFMRLEPLTPGRYWILAAWFPYWLLNIFGEEILWRGVMLPRQELAYGRFAWIFHGFLWGLFHIPFGINLLLTLIPILFIQSYVVQKRGNTWTGVIIHASVNGPGFIAIAFGLL